MTVAFLRLKVPNIGFHMVKDPNGLIGTKKKPNWVEFGKAGIPGIQLKLLLK